MKALLIIDLQNDFLDKGALEVPDSLRIIPVINRLIKKFDEVILTKDWHPEDHLSFVTNHKNKNIYETVDVDGYKQILWPKHCVQNSFGSEFPFDLILPEKYKIILKGTKSRIDSYSAFFDNLKLNKTELDEYLKSKNIDELYVCGLATDYCVNYTVLDALELGYKVKLVKEAIAAVNIEPDDEKKVLKNLSNMGVELISWKELYD